jgi:hypothetical protein
MDLLQYYNEGIYSYTEGSESAPQEKEGHHEQDKVCTVLLEKVLQANQAFEQRQSQQNYQNHFAKEGQQNS